MSSESSESSESTKEDNSRTINSSENAFTPVAKRTLPCSVIGGVFGFSYAKIFGISNVAEATIAGAAQGLAFSGVYFGMNSLLCWNQNIDPYESNISNHVKSGVVTGTVYGTLRRGIAGSVLGSIFGAGMGGAIYLGKSEFEHWHERERRRRYREG